MDASRATLWWLIAALALAAAVEIALAARSPVIAKDGVTFIGIARQFGRSPIATICRADQHPGYPALIWATRRVIGLFGPGDDLRACVLQRPVVELPQVLPVPVDDGRQQFTDHYAGIRAEQIQRLAQGIAQAQPANQHTGRLATNKMRAAQPRQFLFRLVLAAVHQFQTVDLDRKISVMLIKLHLPAIRRAGCF